jgi:hypothetical protein
MSVMSEYPDDPFDEVIDNHDNWVTEPSLEILYDIMAVMDADAGLSEHCD